MMNKHYMSGLLLAGLLAGCATPPPQQPPGTRTAPHVLGSSVSMSGNAPGGAAPGADTKKGDKPVARDEMHPGTGVFVKPAAASAPGVTSTGDEVMLNFEGADLREVVKAFVVDFLGETYIMDTRVQGVVSLHTTRPIPRKALLPTLETVLRMNGAAIVREEGLYKVIPAASAVRGSITPQLGAGSAALPSGYSVQIVPLKFIGSREMIKILEPFVSDATAVRVDEVRNLMILAGTERELRHLMDTIDMFDIDWLAGMSVGLFTLQSVDAKTAVADLDKVFGAGAQNPLSGIVKLVPIERLNAILVVTQQVKYLEQAKTWIERMDRAGGAGGGTRLFVYPVQNGQAEKIAALLNDVFGKAKTARTTPPATLAPGLAPAVVNSTPVTPVPAPTPTATIAPQAFGTGDSVAVSGEVRVIADKDNNALLILASPSDYEKIESAVRKLDVVPRQVLVDVTIAEVNLTGNLQFGLQWYFGSSVAKSGGAAGGSLFTPNSNGGILSGTGATYLWSNARAGAVMNLLQTDSRSKIISSPHLMVVDNHPAKIEVGDTISIPVTTLSNNTVTTGFTPQPTGIILSVTPHINAGGMVTLEISQEVSSVASNTVALGPTISKRSIQSTVVVKSGETMAMGGLIKEQKDLNKNGLPFFSQIPVVGGLFGDQGDRSDRTELVIMITPRVVETSLQAQEVTDEFRKKLGGLADFFDKSGKFGDRQGEEKRQK